MRKNEVQPGVELIPSATAIVRARTGIDEAELARLVQEKVAEIMAERDAVVMEPFFRSRQIAYELRRLQTVPEQKKWSVYFERYGCLTCQTKKRIHVGCGMCQTCYARTFQILSQIIAEGITGQSARPAQGATKAQRLLPENRPMNAAHHTWFQPRGVSLQVVKEALLAAMPNKAHAMRQAELLRKAGIIRLATGQKALAALLAEGKIERIGDRQPYRYFKRDAHKREVMK